MTEYIKKLHDERTKLLYYFAETKQGNHYDYMRNFKRMQSVTKRLKSLGELHGNARAFTDTEALLHSSNKLSDWRNGLCTGEKKCHVDDKQMGACTCWNIYISKCLDAGIHP